MRNKTEIEKFMDEAFTRVAYERKQMLLQRIAVGADSPPPGYSAPTEEWEKKRLELVTKGIQSCLSKGYIDQSDPMDGYSYEYWEGILSALRWVTGDEKHFLDT